MFGRPDSWPGGPNPAAAGRSQPAVAPRYGDRHDFAGSQIWGQTRNLGGRTVDLVDLTKPRSDGRGQPQRPEYGDRHAVCRHGVSARDQSTFGRRVCVIEMGA